ncbi:MAG: hypothetical protein O7H41_18550 [Planctomycetota bacterium]|nr:hypothetical protein [Planctomycetota bacterium]
MRSRSHGTLGFILGAGVILTFVGCGGGGSSSKRSAPPDAPASATAIGATSQATIDWAAVTYATGYNIYFSTSPGVTKSSGTLLMPVTRPHLHTGLTNGTTYYYVVTALDGARESVESPETCAFVLGAPTGVSASAASVDVTLDWSPVPGATSYNIYWSTTPGVSRFTGTPIAGAQQPQLITGLSPGIAHYFTVLAIAATPCAGTSVESIEVTATPDVVGMPDTTLGGSGFVVHDDAAGGTGDDEGRGIVVDALGRIVVAGYSGGPGVNADDLAVWRFLDDGTLDSAFNGQGWTSHHDAGGGAGDDSGWDVTLDGAGKIVVTGSTESAAAAQDMAIWRFNDDGTLDASFNSQGWVTHNGAAGASNDDQGLAVTLDATGNILVAGNSEAAAQTDMAIWRFLPDGNLDLSFNGQGWATHDNAAGGMGIDVGTGIAVDAGGRILVSGWSDGGGFNNDMVVWRFDATGALDSSFNGQGWFVHSNAAGGNGTDLGLDVRVDTMGRIVVSGSSSGVQSDTVVWRLTSTGALDTTFNLQGWVAHDNAAGGTGADAGEAISIDAAGRILVAGYSRSPADFDMVIWRFDSSGNLDTSFNSQGWLTQDSAAGGPGHDWGFGVTQDLRGRVLVTGSSQDATGNYDMAVWRIR